MRLKPLNSTQRALMLFLYWRTVLDGVPPSVREMCTHLRATSTNGMHERLERLITRGMVTRRMAYKQNGSRTWTLTPQGKAIAQWVRCDVPKALGGLDVLSGGSED